MSAYPDWVNQYKQKGTAIKKVGNSYYLYKATSKRVPGKKYPQPLHSYIGTITQDGVIITTIRKISTESVRVYEYGFSYTLSKLIPAYAEFEAVYDFEANLIDGELPRKQRKIVEAWTLLHSDELNTAWRAWNESGEIIKIEGLR